jgi:hypothetical protein
MVALHRLLNSLRDVVCLRSETGSNDCYVAQETELVMEGFVCMEYRSALKSYFAIGSGRLIANLFGAEETCCFEDRCRRSVKLVLER